MTDEKQEREHCERVVFTLLEQRNGRDLPPAVVLEQLLRERAAARSEGEAKFEAYKREYLAGCVNLSVHNVLREEYGKLCGEHVDLKRSHQRLSKAARAVQKEMPNISGMWELDNAMGQMAAALADPPETSHEEPPLTDVEQAAFHARQGFCVCSTCRRVRASDGEHDA